MKVAMLSEMTKGWFIGDFTPSLLKTNAFEVAVKEYSKGDREERHYHKIATEFTVIISGNVSMNGTIYGKGSIIIMEPGEATDFVALEDTVNLVVKTPCVIGDKYIGEYHD